MPWPVDGRHSSSRSRCRAAPTATPGCSTPRRRGSRSRTRRPTRSSSTSSPTPGSTAASSPTAGPPRPSPRTTRTWSPSSSAWPATPLEPVDPSAAVAIPLNAWGRGRAARRPRPTPTPRRSSSLGRSPSAPGSEGLRRTWSLAAAGIPAYPPDPGVDPLTDPAASSGPAGPPDWRALLDLLEGATGQPLDDLWRTWVTRPEDLAALDARGPARAAYERTRQAAPAVAAPAADPRVDARLALRRGHRAAAAGRRGPRATRRARGVGGRGRPDAARPAPRGVRGTGRPRGGGRGGGARAARSSTRSAAAEAARPDDERSRRAGDDLRRADRGGPGRPARARADVADGRRHRDRVRRGASRPRQRGPTPPTSGGRAS